MTDYPRTPQYHNKNVNIIIIHEFPTHDAIFFSNL